MRNVSFSTCAKKEFYRRIWIRRGQVVRKYGNLFLLLITVIFNKNNI